MSMVFVLGQGSEKYISVDPFVSKMDQQEAGVPFEPSNCVRGFKGKAILISS